MTILGILILLVSLFIYFFGIQLKRQAKKEGLQTMPDNTGGLLSLIKNRHTRLASLGLFFGALMIITPYLFLGRTRIPVLCCIS